MPVGLGDTRPAPVNRTLKISSVPCSFLAARSQGSRCHRPSLRSSLSPLLSPDPQQRTLYLITDRFSPAFRCRWHSSPQSYTSLVSVPLGSRPPIINSASVNLSSASSGPRNPQQAQMFLGKLPLCSDNQTQFVVLINCVTSTKCLDSTGFVTLYFITDHPQCNLEEQTKISWGI